jgi:ATP-binding protein involved in chromosome partitioning
MKTYSDIVSDGGSDVVGQIALQSERMRDGLAGIRHIVAIMSGKGGVGKSSVAMNLAAAWTRDGHAVGIVDGDINGPTIGRMAGVGHVPAGISGDRVIPQRTAGGVKVMTMDLFLSDETSPVVWDAPTQNNGFAWRGLMEAGALRELVADTEWGALDYLIVDLPPGSDRLQNLADILPRISGAVAVTVPSSVSLGIVGKSVRMARLYLETPILGLVENMAACMCPACGYEDELYPGGYVKNLAEELDLEILGRIPFDPLLAAAADEGRSYVDEHTDRPAARAIMDMARRIHSLITETVPTS